MASSSRGFKKNKKDDLVQEDRQGALYLMPLNPRPRKGKPSGPGCKAYGSRERLGKVARKTEEIITKHGLTEVLYPGPSHGGVSCREEATTMPGKINCLGVAYYIDNKKYGGRLYS
jgi:hypothetical protein